MELIRFFKFEFLFHSYKVPLWTTYWLHTEYSLASGVASLHFVITWPKKKKCNCGHVPTGGGGRKPRLSLRMLSGSGHERPPWSFFSSCRLTPCQWLWPLPWSKVAIVVVWCLVTLQRGWHVVHYRTCVRFVVKEGKRRIKSKWPFFCPCKHIFYTSYGWLLSE